MAAKPTRVYPIRGHFLLGIPAAVHEVESQAAADELIATGAFTLNANDPERDRDAADLTAPPSEPQAEETPAPPAEE